MEVSVETVSTLERRMKVVVPADRVDSQVTERVREAATSVRLKGFRPGKVPVREIQRRFGAGIRQEVTGEVIQESFVEAVEEQNLRPAGVPKIEDLSSESGQNLEFTALFEVYPEITLAGYEQIEVVRPVAEVTDADLETMIENLRERSVEYADIERAAALEDRVTIDFEGFTDGEAFEGGTAEDVQLVLGSNRMIPGFEEGLVGAKAGDETTLELTFPEDYQNQELAGKPAEFQVKVKTVAEPSLPELNEEFFQRYGVESGDLEEFRAEIRSNMVRELNAAIKSKVKNQVMDGLLEVNELNVPSGLVDTEIDRMRQEAVQQFGGANAGQIDSSILPAEMFKPRAEKRVSLGLLMGEVLEKEELEVDPDRVRAHIEDMAGPYEDPEQVVNWYYANEEQLARVESVVLEDQLVERILETAVVREENVSYEEAVKPPAPELPPDGENPENDAESGENAGESSEPEASK